MTMLGRGKRSAPKKDEGPREDGDGKAGKAAAQATKAEEAAEAARLAEEAAARAREAARLAQIAADAAAAADAEDTDAEDTEEDAPAKAVKTAVKPRRTKKAPESVPEDDDPAADESAADEAPADDALKTEAEEDTDEAEDEPDDALETEADEAEDEDEDGELEDEDDEPADEAKPRTTKKALAFKRAAKTDEPRRRVGTGRFTLLAVMTVLFLALGTAATVLILKDHKQNAIDDARRDGLWAASKAAQELSSYDYRTIDADTKAAAAMTTGKLHDDYVKQLPSFKAQATAQQLVGTTTVMKTGAISASPDKVVVLVYADRSSATKNDKTPQLPESLRLKMTMVKVDGKWLAQKVDVIS
ncbi:hypothetical protein [Actinomadura opuntiae]|uniref:hypothetical protein n=1 Tax=Actinomadura sp. OS1-43 TaxID=604315 RepID=UPI00255A721E|nr:hypothetical protein [Actinomadura sp. OS1-43]MDL4820909.1 hypothetical protein [Actinomadura sp. OS1-43]